MLEKDIERYLVQQVRLAGGLAYKFVSPANRGVCDRLIILNGQVWFVEVKAPNGRLTALQLHFKGLMATHRMKYVTVWNKEDVDALIKAVSG